MNFAVQLKNGCPPSQIEAEIKNSDISAGKSDGIRISPPSTSHNAIDARSSGTHPASSMTAVFLK